MMKKSGFAMFAAAAFMVGGVAQADDLPLDEVTTGNTGNGEYTFTCEEPGLLVLIARAGADVLITVTDAAGNDLPGGRIDGDIEGDFGAEQGVVAIRQSGEYKVTVIAFGEETDFSFFAGWVSADLSDLLD